MAFPNSDPGDNPEVALTFDRGKDGFEKRLSDRLSAAMTGVEGLVCLVDEDGQPVTEDWLPDFPGLKLRLLDGQGKEIAVRELRDYPYYCFPGLPGVPEWGSDYRVVLSGDGEGSSDGKVVFEDYEMTMEAQYVPVRTGMRSRKDLVVKLIDRQARQQAEKFENYEKSGEVEPLTGVFELLKTNVPGAISGAIDSLTGIYPLGLILNILPPNPGVHFGFVQTKDAGPQMFLSARFKFRADVPDRSPQFVAKGAIRMEVMTVPSDSGRVSAHYIKVTWRGPGQHGPALPGLPAGVPVPPGAGRRGRPVDEPRPLLCGPELQDPRRPGDLRRRGSSRDRGRDRGGHAHVLRLRPDGGRGDRPEGPQGRRLEREQEGDAAGRRRADRASGRRLLETVEFSDRGSRMPEAQSPAAALEALAVPKIDRLDFVTVKLPFVAPFGTSVYTWTDKEALLLRLESDGVTAWSECVSDPDPFYFYETNGTVRHIVKDFLLPLVEPGITLGELDTRFRRVRGHGMAKATVENGLLDPDRAPERRSLSTSSWAVRPGRSCRA